MPNEELCAAVLTDNCVALGTTAMRQTPRPSTQSGACTCTTPECPNSASAAEACWQQAFRRHMT
eukprot:CAMPEP_0174720332 /NCGR_PEP_ID=MMETSP1094-20130205/33314_1 /TAXON_ID=156173 /ORGANISM="Chrysochromulina brevifilum, Strain UTEX LB 985" /LENGTH=63 /DNA_ID=CAMNT_0015920799 /DNA_START=716 /DNA_END=904 /DNA_ORIENTATION=-